MRSFRPGLLIFSMGMIAVLVQGVVISKLARRYSDQQLLLAGTALMIAALVSIALMGSWAGLIAGGILLSIGFSMLTPTFNAQLSRAAEGIQGEAQGLNNSAQSLSRMVGPLAFISMYSWLGTSTPYLVASLLCVLALVLAALRLDQEHALIESPSRDGSASHR